MAPIFFDYQRTPLGLKKTKIALDIFNTYLQRGHCKYAAGGNYLLTVIFAFTIMTELTCYVNLMGSKMY